jgi:branched-chain amino acid transport system substrate-binding protein
MQKYYPNGNLSDGSNGYGYAVANLLHIALKQAGNDLTRANIMKEAANLKDIQLPMIITGVKVNTSPTDFYPIQSVRMNRFKGETWEQFGEILSSDSKTQ